MSARETVGQISPATLVFATSAPWRIRRPPPGAKDVPTAEVHVLDGGHFALDTQAEEIATLVSDFMQA
jgi:surfactin synthase thioesterase subunit